MKFRFGSIVLTACVAGAGATASAQEQAYNVDPEHTFPTYAIEHFGVSLQRGRFDSTQGRIILNPTAKTGSVEIVMQTASVSSGVPSLDRRLRSDEWFDAARNPQIVFRANTVRFADDQPVALEGELTMHGVTRPLTLEVSRFRCTIHPLAGGKRCGALARGTVRRSDYALGRLKPPLLADEVELSIVVEATLDPNG
ncbi:MAG TPA: YceI family protein [Burkholderiaceae bacterium]|nr:YceI family protein [Burkholderiaceae bacterium]